MMELPSDVTHGIINGHLIMFYERRGVHVQLFGQYVQRFGKDLEIFHQAISIPNLNPKFADQCPLCFFSTNLNFKSVFIFKYKTYILMRTFSMAQFIDINIFELGL